MAGRPFYGRLDNVSWTEASPGIVAPCNTTYDGDTNGYFRVHIDELSPDLEPIEFTRRAEHYAECVWHDRTPKTPGEKGLRGTELMSQIYLAAGLPGLERAEIVRLRPRTHIPAVK